MSNGGRVTTELDIELAKLKLKAEEAKAEFRKLSKAAEDTKLGEKMEAGMKKSTVMEFRGMKEAAEKSAAEAAKAAAAKWKEIVTPAVSDPWRMQQSAASRAMLQSSGGGSRLAMGNVGMQVQDIAVQAQMGTSALTIMAQQGSQLASIFGPGGMIIGGLVAVGGALLMAGKKGDDAFQDMIKGAKEFHDALGDVIQTGTIDSITAAMEKLQKTQEEITKGQSTVNAGSFWDFSKGVLGVMTGGDTFNEKRAKLKEAELRATQDEKSLNEAALIASEREVKLAELRAAGKNKEADALERQFRLISEIQKIQNSDFNDATKERLIADARSISESEGTENSDASDKKWEAARERRIQLSKQFADAERAVEVASMTATEKLVDLNRQRLDLERQIKAESNDEKKLQLATERERIEAQIVTSQTAMAKEAENAEKARQERIAGLQKDLAGKEKNLAKLENPTPTQTFRAAGALSSQFDWMFGGSSALVSESTNQNTDAMKDLKEEIKGLKEKLGDLNIQTTAVFTP
jgi:hypothetical protein